MHIFWKVDRRPNQTLWVRMSTDHDYPWFQASARINSRKDVPERLKHFSNSVKEYLTTKREGK
jgi:hypothetical protein